MHKSILIPAALLLTAMTLGLRGTADAMPEIVELDEADVFIEWNATDSEYGLVCALDSDGFIKMRVSSNRGKPLLDLKTKSRAKAQGFESAEFESVAEEDADLPLPEFLARFPAGEYQFKGKSVDGERLIGDAELTHRLPAPPTNLFPEGGDVVSHEGFLVGFDPVTQDTDGNPIDIEYYVLIVEKEDDEPILQTLEVILRPSQTTFFVPETFLEPDTEYVVEVIAVEESGNRTVVETDGFDTDE